MTDKGFLRTGKMGSPSGSSERFGYEWNLYPELMPEYEEQFRRWTIPLSASDWKTKWFLDAGCGTGRNSYWAMQFGAGGGVAIDIDDRPLAVARRNLGIFPSVQVIRASLYEIPFRETFDIAFSIGVIHHLEHPEIAMRELVQSVKVGGQVLIWVYGRENNGWVVNLLDPARQWIFARLPIPILHAFSILPAIALWMFVRLGIFRTEYFQLMRRFRFRHIRSIVFDQMLPRIAHYWPQETVLQFMKGAGLMNIKVHWVNRVSWSAIGTRPPNRSTL